MDKHTLDALFVSLSSASAAPLPLSNGFADMYQEFVDAQVGPDDAKPGIRSAIATTFGRLAEIAAQLRSGFEPRHAPTVSR